MSTEEAREFQDWHRCRSSSQGGAVVDGRSAGGAGSQRRCETHQRSALLGHLCYNAGESGRRTEHVRLPVSVHLLPTLPVSVTASSSHTSSLGDNGVDMRRFQTLLLLLLFLLLLLLLFLPVLFSPSSYYRHFRVRLPVSVRSLRVQRRRLCVRLAGRVAGRGALPARLLADAHPDSDVSGKVTWCRRRRGCRHDFDRRAVRTTLSDGKRRRRQRNVAPGRRADTAVARRSLRLVLQLHENRE